MVDNIRDIQSCVCKVLQCFDCASVNKRVVEGSSMSPRQVFTLYIGRNYGLEIGYQKSVNLNS